MRGGLSFLLITTALVLVQPALAAEVAPTSPADVSADDTADADTIIVTGSRERRITTGATHLPISIKDTPQSVTVIDKDVLRTLQIDDANSALKMITGINVQSVETNRTYYDARGFELKSMQTDGIAMPFAFNIVGPIDTQFYDRIEAIKGANGLLTGTGTPAGTINYVRRRPLNSEQGELQLKAGSHSFYRVDGDWNMPLTKDARWALRVSGGAQSKDGYLRGNHESRTMVQAIVEGQIGEAVTATAGYSQQRDRSRGVLWGALPLIDAAGAQIDYADRGASTSMDWTYWNSQARSAFGEVSVALSADWKAKASLTHSWTKTQAELFYIYGAPDQKTGNGLMGWPGAYDEAFIGTIGEAQLSGIIAAFGREHDVIVGINHGRLKKTESDAAAAPTDPAWGPVGGWRPDAPNAGWTGREIARPNWGPWVEKQNYTDKLTRVYAVTRLSLADPLKLILGANFIDASTHGESFGKPMDKAAKRLSPYAGVTFALTPAVNLYASYSDIFEPQSELKADLTPLGPAVGRSYEAGAKGEFFGGRLLATLAVFRAEQDNLADKIGKDPATNKDIYRGIFARSQGVEAEVTGKVGRDLMVRLGGTYLSLKDRKDKDVRVFMPRKTANLVVAYTPHQLSGASLGGYARWQSDIATGTAKPIAVQDDYVVAGLFAKAPIAEGITVSANVDNVTDSKYLTSLKWDQAFYGAPRSYSAAISFRF